MPILSKSPPLHLYKVCFEERWQGKFEDLDDALNWGREVGETGRLVHVVDRGVFTTTLWRSIRRAASRKASSFGGPGHAGRAGPEPVPGREASESCRRRDSNPRHADHDRAR
jgi:hypothetical protein